MKKVVTRFAPSPTGFMHVGGIRTALYAYLWAKKNHGTFILRIEDTDKDREVPGSKEHIIESLSWLKISYDEGPYIQSERLDIYTKWAQKLIDAGFAYPDPYTKEELATFREKAELEKRLFLFRDHRPEHPGTWDGTQPLRFKTPIKEYSWTDVVRGDLSAGEEAVDDFILIKADGYPTYNFAHIVDDIEMGVTLVCRGEEFISSMPKFLAVYEALRETPPEFATLPPILGPGGTKKLSKRDGAKDVLEYRDEGYLPDSITNFLALLGWHPEGDKEVFTREELLEYFDIHRVQRSGAQLDIQKLEWLNREHMKMLPYEKQEARITEYLPEAIRNTLSTEQLHDLVPTIMERIGTFSDVTKMAEEGEFDLFTQDPTLNLNLIHFKESDIKETIEHLEKISHLLGELPDGEWKIERIKERIMSYADTLLKRGPALHPVRYALSGRERSPDPFTIATIIGKQATMRRLKTALDNLVQ